MKICYKKLTGLIVLLCSAAILVKADQPADTVIHVRIDFSRSAQTINNIGASGCWFSEGIGKFWPAEKKEKIASLLFSKKLDKNGNPEGIGLSSWRFNIGAGTSEQGESSGIKDFRKRTESFLKPDGTYDWNKQSGYQFFLKKAHDYGVETLIAFSNSPPVQFTKNGLGYKTEKNYTANLKTDQYAAYADFLAQVIKHFDQQGLHFQYVSPVNEPQWDWSHKYMEADQEGSPWKNEDIYKITQQLDLALSKEKLDSKILIAEAGMLNYLYGGSKGASHQIQQFFEAKSPLNLGGLPHVPRVIAGHSYFTESNDSTLLATRKKLADTAKRYGVEYWESEYSMLADGFREGAKGKRSAMDCALFLSKVIHADLTIGNATAWQFWNAYEPGDANFDTRYYLIALHPNPDFKDGEFKATKNLWAMGHYSLFVRPGMQRIETKSDKNLLVSAFTDKNNKLVVVSVNEGITPVKLKLDLKKGKKKYKKVLIYLTADGDELNMKAMPVQSYLKDISLPARSIATIVMD
ncbi:glycoside hydrolase [Pedobacter sp. L105]|uniref:glycoside hydrolase n=1 Tax=Pedobacter sp. L105 TaxID=1641871 RepID=UPI00131BC51B|nr:glycoside hydrolase [Pedobacter sp. L105]